MSRIPPQAPRIAVVIPTIRPDSYLRFREEWDDLFERHGVTVVAIFDGDNPQLEDDTKPDVQLSLGEIMSEYSDCITTHSGSIRNLGFAYVAKYLPSVETIITLDDDVSPIGDTIEDHLNALDSRCPVSWMSTMTEYTRGFPYGVRDEAEVVLSHGVWDTNLDWDAPTQLVLGNNRGAFPYMGPIPKGVYFPLCIMNVAFKRKLLPYMFQAPDALGVGRMDDIFSGILCKQDIDRNGWAAVSGLALVNHKRESNVFKNLQKEALGIELNESFWKGDESHPYFQIYREKRSQWERFLSSIDFK